MLKDLKELLQKDRRLVILRVLLDSPGYSANDSLLNSALGTLGHKVSRDLIQTEMYYLEEQGLIKIEEVLGVIVANATSRGIDVATGQALHHGVNRPRPE